MLKLIPHAPATAALLLACVLLYAVTGCGNGISRGAKQLGGQPLVPGAQKGNTMTDELFQQVEIGSLEETPASPQVDMDTFTGIKIAMPSAVMISDSGPIPLCGTWVLPEAVTHQYENLEDSFAYLIRNTETHESHTGHFRRHEDPAVLPPDEMPSKGIHKPDPEDADTKIMGWFNFDLARVWKVPSKPGRFRIQVVLDEFQSNIAEFEVKGK